MLQARSALHIFGLLTERTMGRLVWIWIVGLLAAAPPVGQSPTGQKPRRPWVLEGPNVVIVSPPPAVAAVARPYLDDAFKGVAADLNRDGTDDYIMQGRRDECGTGGCSYWIFDGATAKRIGDAGGNAIVVRAENTNGFPNLETYSRSSSESGAFSLYVFDGNAYVRKSSTFLEGGPMWAKLRTWRTYPRWPPQTQ